MAKDPAFLFYPSDFLTGTAFMTNEDIGIYIKLLCFQHQHGGIIDKISFNALVGEKQLLRSKFEETDLGFYNVKLMTVIEKRSKKSTNISKAVKDVWEKRKCDSNTIPLNIDAIPSKNDAINMGTININETNYLGNSNIIKGWFLDLENGSLLQDISMKTELSIPLLKTKLRQFEKKCDLSYPTYGKFVNHFKNWVILNPKDPDQAQFVC